MPPSLFLTNRTGAPHGGALGLINFFSKGSLIYFLSSANSRGDILYGAMDIGPIPGTNSMANSISLSGGNSGYPQETRLDIP